MEMYIVNRTDLSGHRQFYSRDGWQYHINRATPLSLDEARGVVADLPEFGHVSIGRVFVQERTKLDEWKHALRSYRIREDANRVECLADHIHRMLGKFPDNPGEVVNEITPVGWSVNR